MLNMALSKHPVSTAKTATARQHLLASLGLAVRECARCTSTGATRIPMTQIAAVARQFGGGSTYSRACPSPGGVWSHAVRMQVAVPEGQCSWMLGTYFAMPAS